MQPKAVQKRNKYLLVLFLLFCLFNFILFLKGKFDAKEFERNGVYVLAVIKTKEGLENGISLTCEYYFKGAKYMISYPQHRLHETNDSLVFIHILKDNPEKWQQMDKMFVPKCLLLKDVPHDGWTILPKDTCQ